MEEAFKNLKGDLGVHSGFHQKLTRTEAHILVAFMAYTLHVCLRPRLRAMAGGLSPPRAVLEKFSAVRMVDVHLPTTNGREVILTRRAQPEKEQRVLLAKLEADPPGAAATQTHRRPHRPCSGDFGIIAPETPQPIPLHSRTCQVRFAAGNARQSRAGVNRRLMLLDHFRLETWPSTQLRLADPEMGPSGKPSPVGTARVYWLPRLLVSVPPLWR